MASSGFFGRLRGSRSPTHQALTPSTSATNLCKNCSPIILSQNALGKNLPESMLRSGSVALDLNQGYFDIGYKVRDTYPSLPFLRKSASAGCSFCALLAKSIDEDRLLRPQIWNQKFKGDGVHIRLRYSCEAELGSQTFGGDQWPTMLSSLQACICSNPSASDDAIVLIFKLYCDSGSLVADYLRIHRRPVDLSTLSDRNLQMVDDWMHTCSLEHHTCILEGPTESRSRPTRLVDIGADGEQSRLVVTSEIEVGDLRYAALSYCWGLSSGHRMTTMRETYHERLNGIPWDTLPQNYRDAFTATRLLKLRYIWIDSLCIIQDDEEDWQHEAARMGDIYRNAHITIGAVAAGSTDDGFLERAPPQAFIAVPFTATRHPDITGNYYISCPDEQADKEGFFHDVELSVWNKRGWTFQERILSRRILFFGRRMLHFECRTLRRSENYASSLKRSIRWHHLIQNGYRWSSLSESWRALVAQYSERSFTFEVDVLPALSSLAREFANAQVANGEPVRYLAGLWMRDLCQQLLWASPRPKPSEKGNPKPNSPYIAPSWSWCSSPGVVSWLEVGGSVKDECTFLDAKTRIAGTDSMGRVVDGYLEIEGRIRLEALPNIGAAANDIVNKTRHVFEISNPVGPYNYTGTYHVDFDFGMGPEEKAYLLSEGLWLALLCRRQGDSSRGWLYGIALAPRSDDSFKAGHFRRIGVFQARNIPNLDSYKKRVYKIF